MVSASYDGMLLAAAPHAINVDFDLTFVVQLVLFAALALVLKPLLFDPMIKVFETRERLIDGVKSQARHIDEKSAGAIAAYEAKMNEARAVGNTEREKARSEGIQREAEILGVVRAATARTLEERKRAMSSEAERVREALSAEVAAIGQDVAARVLGREVKP